MTRFPSLHFLDAIGSGLSKGSLAINRSIQLHAIDINFFLFCPTAVEPYHIISEHLHVQGCLSLWPLTSLFSLACIQHHQLLRSKLQEMMLLGQLQL